MKARKYESDFKPVGTSLNQIRLFAQTHSDNACPMGLLINCKSTTLVFNLGSIVRLTTGSDLTTGSIW